jgi:peptidoglycan/xylan/chitin deacetylase (PgdA/CDA1 family)
MMSGFPARYGRKAARFALRQVPTGLYRCVIPRDAIGFVYHTVASRPLPHVKHLYAFKTPEEFEQDIQFFRSRYSFLSLDDLRYAKPRGKRPGLFITFDDGMAECFRVVRPILLKHRVPCVFFITTAFLDNKEMFYRHKVSLCIEAVNTAPNGRQDALLQYAGVSTPSAFKSWIKNLTLAEEATIDQVCALCGVDPATYLQRDRPYLTSDEIHQMIADGFTIGAHTLRHPILSKLSSPSLIESEIVDSCSAIRKMTKADKVPFAFPYSADGIDRSFLRNILAKHDFIGPLFDAHGIAAETPFIRTRIAGDVRRPAGSLIRQAYVNESQKRLRIPND